MKVKIGKQNLLYPMPVTVIGIMIEGKANFVNVSHVGILTVATPIQPSLIMFGMNKIHYSNIGIREKKVFSVNIISVDDMVKADYAGMVSGKNVDKSGLFKTFFGELRDAPIIENCPLSMECRLYDTYDTPQHDVFIGEIVASYAQESVIVDGKVDLAKVNPLLFDMSGPNYWSLGKNVGNCWNEGKRFCKS